MHAIIDYNPLAGQFDMYSISRQLRCNNTDRVQLLDSNPLWSSG